MKNNLWLWQFGGFVFAVALGTLLHFLFVWTGFLCFAPISAVNESTWEHIKILFFPTLIFGFIQSAYFRQDCIVFWWIKLIGVLVGCISIPILFYTVNGAFGKTPDWLNIIFFFLSAGLGYFVEYLLFRKNFSLQRQFLALGILLVIALFFFAFTLQPPRLPIFQDPLTKGYGIMKR